MANDRWRSRIELVAAVSVVATLILLVVEVRANTKALERQIRLDRTSNIAAPYTSGPELLEAFEKIKNVDGWNADHQAFMERYELEPSEAVAWSMFLLNVWRGLEADHDYVGPSDELTNAIRGLLVYPDNRLFYDPQAFSSDFAAYVERVSPGPYPIEGFAHDTGTASNTNPRAEVRQALESYYDAFSDRDWPRFADQFWPGAMLATIWTPPGETAERVVATSIPEFVDQAPLGPGSREIFEERMTSSRITVEGDLAHAWAEYDARFGDPGDVAEWSGIDAFTLLRHGDEWRIISLAYVPDVN